MKEEQNIKKTAKKWIDKLPFHVQKKSEKESPEDQDSIAFEQLKEGAEVNKKSKKPIGELFTLTIGKGKDVKAHRELKQSEKGIVLIVLGALATLLAFNNLYQPLSLEHKEIQSLKAKSVISREGIEAQLSKKNETKDNISKLKTKLSGYELMYPNYRTQNEVLVLLTSIVGNSGGKLTSISVSDPIPVQKSKVNESISNKGIGSSLKNSNFFSANTPEEDTSTTETIETVDTKFEYTESMITISSLDSVVDALKVVKLLHESNREIIPTRIKILKGDEGYSVEGTLYFYAYRNSKDANNLF